MSSDRRPDPLTTHPKTDVGSPSLTAGRPDAEPTATDSLGIPSFNAGPPDELGEAELIVIAHPDPKTVGSRFRVPRHSSVTIGRGDSADLRVTGSPSLSRHHATFGFTTGAVTVEDAGSRNGTFVNGRRIEGPVELVSGDRIQIGGIHCKFLRELDVEGAYHDALLELATRDGLTGAHNRRFFEDELEREVARARRHGQSLSLILLDVDHFKGVNDSHGHVVGDQVLREMVTFAREHLPDEQVLARLGGEEFAVLCREVQAPEAAVIAERLRAAIAGHAMQCLAGKQAVTCSFGVAALTALDRAAPDLYGRADQALYRSKSGGRNRVTIAAEDLAAT